MSTDGEETHILVPTPRDRRINGNDMGEMSAGSVGVPMCVFFVASAPTSRPPKSPCGGLMLAVMHQQIRMIDLWHSNTCAVPTNLHRTVPAVSLSSKTPFFYAQMT